MRRMLTGAGQRAPERRPSDYACAIERAELTFPAGDAHCAARVAADQIDFLRRHALLDG